MTAVYLAMLAFLPHSTAALRMVLAFGGGYLGGRLFEWLRSTVLDVRRGSGRHRRRTCPTCGRRIWRTGGDWILCCHDCGWIEGLPVARWLTRSVPVRNLWRRRPSIRRVIGVSLVTAFAVATVAATVGTGIAPIDSRVTTLEEDTGFDDAGTIRPTPILDDVQPAASATSTEPAAATDGSLNRTLVEDEFITRLNEERRQKGLELLSRWHRLTELGVSHSRNMATHGYIGHEEPPDDKGIEERYRAAGLLPQCRIPLPNADRHYPGAENAFAALYNREMRRWWDNETVRLDSERELAQYLFRGWMHSREHREAMLTPNARRVGLGLYMTENGKVYASLELCS